MTSAVRLLVENVSVAYGATPVVSGISLALKEGAIGCLLGPSGCGKTSLLRAIAGFEPVTSGRVVLDGKEVSRPGFTMPTERRNVGMVFQDFALFPHLSVWDNVKSGLRAMTPKAAGARVEELLDLVGLMAAAKSFPHELSGGQQQRVALARAMAPRPAILLMDEPFSAIDPDLRERLAGEVRDMLTRDGMTAVLVTHDQFEAFAMADRIAVLDNGRLMQEGTAYDLYHLPANRAVADFIGEGTMVPGTVLDGGRVETPLGIVEGILSREVVRGQCVEVLVRPDDIVHDDTSPIQFKVVKKDFRGAAFRYTLRVSEGVEVLCMVQSHHDHAVGEMIGVRVRMDHVSVFSAIQ